MSDYKIPSRDEHNNLIRKIWKGCLIAAAVCLVLMMAIVTVMSMMGYDSQKIVSVMLIAVYIVVPVYGVGYIGPAFATSLLKMGMAVEMSREGLDIGRETATTISDVKAEIKPLVSDLQRIVADLKPMIEEFRKQDFAKIHKVLGRFEGELNGGGKLDRLVVSIEKIAKRTDQKADDALDDVLGSAWAKARRIDGKCSECGTVLKVTDQACINCSAIIESPGKQPHA